MGELYRELLVRLGADAFQAVFITFTFFFWGYLRQFQKALKIFLNLFSFFLLSFSIFLWGALHFRHGSKAQLRRGKLCWNVVLRLCLFEMVTQTGGGVRALMHWTLDSISDPGFWTMLGCMFVLSTLLHVSLAGFTCLK